MKVFIPSKDRSCQLHCLLESMVTNLPNIDFDIHVLYKASDSNFLDGYHKLFDYYLDKSFSKTKIVFYSEVSFYDQFMIYLERNKNEYVMLLTDDCVFYRNYAGEESNIRDLIQDNVWSFSFRLGLNTTTQWYRTGQQQMSLDALGCEYFGNNYSDEDAPSYVKWNWKIRPAYENYGYMMSWDGHIYRAADLLELAKKSTFYNPRTFEDRVTKDLNFRMSIPRKYMISPAQSCLFVNTINAVQEEPPPFGDKYKISPEELNELYLNGQVIDIDTFRGLELSGSHDEIPLKFKRV